jgi:hypothetical protein
MALAIGAALLLQHAPAHIADVFCTSRLAAGGHRNYGTLPAATTARRSSSAPQPARERGDAAGAPALGRRPPAICSLIR